MCHHHIPTIYGWGKIIVQLICRSLSSTDGDFDESWVWSVIGRVAVMIYHDNADSALDNRYTFPQGAFCKTWSSWFKSLLLITILNRRSCVPRWYLCPPSLQGGAYQERLPDRGADPGPRPGVLQGDRFGWKKIILWWFISVTVGDVQKCCMSYEKCFNPYSVSKNLWVTCI